MSNIVKIESADLEFEVDTEERFDEDNHNEKVMKKIKEKKGPVIENWLQSILPWSAPKKFNPPLLSNEEYLKMSIECFDEALSLLNASNWKKHKKGIADDYIETMETEKYGKLFLLTSTVECPADFLFNELAIKIEEVTKWNPTILESKLIQKIDNETDITYQLTAGGGGGAVKPRDFVLLRRNAKRDDRFLSCGISIEHPECPPNKKYIRGENKISSWITQTIPSTKENESVKCKVQWLMGLNLKGWIPQYVLDVAFSTSMFEFIDGLKKFIDKKRLEKAF